MQFLSEAIPLYLMVDLFNFIPAQPMIVVVVKVLALKAATKHPKMKWTPKMRTPYITKWRRKRKR